MSNYKSYGNHPSQKGRPASPWNCTCIIEAKERVEGVYDRLLELAEGMIRRGYNEDYAMEKAAERLGARDELF